MTMNYIKRKRKMINYMNSIVKIFKKPIHKSQSVTVE